ncbi:MAG: ABC transporter permease [Actinomycetia bacterium]|nr:ABC transporter permease [Actinomycetes bacterium]
MAVARGQLRRQRGSYLALAIIVAIGGGVALGAGIAADRTDRAYASYVERSDVADLVINPSLNSQAITAAIESFDGVVDVHTSSLLLANIGHIESGVLGDLASQDPLLQVLGSIDGRFVDVDRPAVTSGRPPTGDHELFVSNEERPLLEAKVGHPVAVGDTVELSFFWAGLLSDDADYFATVSSLGVESLRISGFGVLPDEVLPDELYPRQRMIVSADVARKYSCVPDFRADMSDAEAIAAAYPPMCSTQYTYFSLTLDGKPGTVASIRDQFAAAAERLTPDLPPVIDLTRAGYYYISQDRAEIDSAVERAIRPTVATLQLFAIVALIATIAIFGIATARVVRRAQTESRTLMDLGASRLQRVVGSVMPAMAAIALGVVGAIAISAVLSPIGPLGSVRVLVDSPGPSLPARLTAIVAVSLLAALAVVTAVVAFALTHRGARSTSQASRSTSRLARVVALWRRPSRTTGINAALDVSRPGTAAAIIGCVVAVACVGGALIFDSNLRTLVEEPAEYGWPWDAAMLVGSGYGGTNLEAVAGSLADNADVDEYAVFALDSSSELDGHGVSVIYGFSEFDAPPFPVVSGRAATNPNEAVLGSNTATRLGLSIGDRLPLRSSLFPDSEVVIVGTAVLPAVGAFLSDRTGLGDGAFVVLDATSSSDAATFVTINLRSGTDPDVFVEGFGSTLDSWSLLYEPPLVLTHAVRSAEIINVGELRSAPLILIRLLGLAMFGGFALSIVVSVRDRQRELSILRVLGFRDSELRASVRWQAFMMMLVGVIVGIPLGILAGRAAWRAFADQLGVVPRASVSIWLLVATVIGSMVLAMIAAIVPARSATRTKSGLVLRRS